MAKRKPSLKPTPVSDSEAVEAMAAVQADKFFKRGQEPEPARNGRATNAGKGQKYRIGPDGKKYATNDIVEFIRNLLIMGHTTGDIKRALASRFGGRGASFQKHIAIARERNRKVLDKDLGQTKSESLMVWFKSMQEANSFKIAAQVEMNQSQQRLTAIAKEIANKPSAIEMKHLLDEREDLRETFGFAMDRYTEFEAIVVRNQAAIDRIIGNNAPYEFKVESKVAIETKPEPLTHEDRAREIAELLAKMTGN